MSAATGYPTPEMRERTKDVQPGTPPGGPAGASSANGHTRPTPKEK